MVPTTTADLKVDHTSPNNNGDHSGPTGLRKFLRVSQSADIHNNLQFGTNRKYGSYYYYSVTVVKPLVADTFECLTAPRCFPSYFATSTEYPW